MIDLLLAALIPVTGLIDASVKAAPESVSRYGFAGQTLETDRSSNTAQADDSVGQAAPVASYRLSGEKSLRPSQIGDDGVHMYIEWSEDQALPAVFALNAIGEEETVDGYMRAGVFTIDRVYQALVFRIGKKRAKAERKVG